MARAGPSSFEARYLERLDGAPCRRTFHNDTAFDWRNPPAGSVSVKVRNSPAPAPLCLHQVALIKAENPNPCDAMLLSSEARHRLQRELSHLRCLLDQLEAVGLSCSQTPEPTLRH